MSSTAIQSPNIFSVSHRFAIRWTLKGKQLNDIPDRSTIRSDIYRFKTIKDLSFFLEIERDGIGCVNYGLSIKGSKNWSFKSSYAFVVRKERAFRLTSSDQLPFLEYFHEHRCENVEGDSNVATYDTPVFSDEEDVTVQCVVIACPLHLAQSAKDDEDLSPMEGQNMIDFEDVPDIPLPSDYWNDMVIDFMQRGDIPYLTVDKAIQIIRKIKVHKCEELKIVCTEYLMRNITPLNLYEISGLALQFGLRHLETSCLNFVALRKHEPHMQPHVS